MKKTLFISLLIVNTFFLANYSSAKEVKTNNYQVVQNETVLNVQAAAITVAENEDVKIVLINDKVAVIDKTKNDFLIQPIIDDIFLFQKDNINEYKIEVGEKIGYFNALTKEYFLTDYNDIALCGENLRVKSNNLFGLIDKKGNVILKPIYEKINLYTEGDKQYISTKLNEKQKLFYPSGEEIKENDIYPVVENPLLALARDLKPIFKQSREKVVVIPDIKSINKEEKTIVAQDIQQKIEEKTPEIIEKNDGVHTAVVKKNVNIEPSIPTYQENRISIGEKDIVLIHDKGFFGVNDLDKNTIIPAEFDSIVAKKLCEHFKDPVLIAEKDGVLTTFDLKGKILAEQVYDKFNVYKYGSVYSYTLENNNWVLRKNKKVIGNLVINKGKYEFKQTAFHFGSLHKINELLSAMITIAKS